MARTGRPGAPCVFDFERDIGGITGIFNHGDDRRRADIAAFLYDAEIMEFDRRFGEFISFLKRSGLYDRSMVILLADHGEEFFEHGSWAHGTDLFNSQIRVPLLVKFPNGRYAGRSFDAPVSLVDVMPTVLEYYAIPAAPADERPLAARRIAQRFAVVRASFQCQPGLPELVAHPCSAALVQDGYKLIRQLPGKSG